MMSTCTLQFLEKYNSKWPWDRLRSQTNLHPICLHIP
jgi:hypothetical protein